jgi:uncharacterized membrane protein YsdA (DUF1294 family)
MARSSSEAGAFGRCGDLRVAQQLLRHKSKKTSFITAFWLSVAVNIFGLIWLMSSSGQEFVQAIFSGNG